MSTSGQTGYQERLIHIGTVFEAPPSLLRRQNAERARGCENTYSGAMQNGAME
jgi:hypothetical protein